MRREFQRKASKTSKEKAKQLKQSVCEKILLRWVEEFMGGEDVKPPDCRELAKGSKKGLFLDFAIVWFCIVFKIERHTNRERARRKGEIEDARKGRK